MNNKALHKNFAKKIKNFQLNFAPQDIPPVCEQTSTFSQFERSLRRKEVIHLKKKKRTNSNDDMDDEVPH